MGVGDIWGSFRSNSARSLTLRRRTNTNMPGDQPGMLAGCAAALVEAVAAGAGSRRVGVVDLEPRLFQGLEPVQDGPSQIRGRHTVDADGDVAEQVLLVAVELAVVEVQRIAEAGAAAWLDGNPQEEIGVVLSLEKLGDLRGSRVGQRNGCGPDGNVRRRPGRRFQCGPSSDLGWICP